MAPAPARLVAVGGLSGTGKSRLAQALAPALAPMPGAVIVRSDVERKALFGVGETDKLPADAYAGDTNARVYGALADKARRIVGAGHSAIVDAVFARPQERAAIADAAVARAQEGYDLGRLEWTTIDAAGTPQDTLARAKVALARVD
jgi:predicted kinase